MKFTILVWLVLMALNVFAQSSKVKRNDIFSQNDPEKKERLAITFFAENKGVNYEDIYFDLASIYAKKGNSLKVAEYAEKMGETSMYYSLVAESLNDSGGDPKLVEKLVRKCIKLDNESSKYSPLMASALYRQEKFEETLPYAKDAFEKSNKRYDDYIASVYINSLLALNKNVEAYPVMDSVLRIRIPSGSPSWQSSFKNAYVEANGSAKGYNEQVLSIKRDSVKSKRELLFDWTDINGKSISLNDYSGKVIVFDFWATWCIPCVQGLPYMQKLVNRYKNDPDVVFFFVATRERGNDPAPVKKFLIDRKLDNLTVLLDQKLNPSDERQRINYLYNIHGIPDKVIVGKNGDLMKLGKNVLDDKAKEKLTEEDLNQEIDWLSSMIEKAKTESL